MLTFEFHSDIIDRIYPQELTSGPIGDYTCHLLDIFGHNVLNPSAAGRIIEFALVVYWFVFPE